jgi:hypothetical protein
VHAFETNPLYWLLHESIYPNIQAQQPPPGAATTAAAAATATAAAATAATTKPVIGWAAQRVHQGLIVPQSSSKSSSSSGGGQKKNMKISPWDARAMAAADGGGDEGLAAAVYFSGEMVYDWMGDG